MKMIIYNQPMLDKLKEDLQVQFEKYGRMNVSYEKAHKERTMAQVGFVFAALINQITDYFLSCGFNVDEEDVRYKLYDEVSNVVPEMVVDKQIFGGRPRIKHISEMDRALCSKFIEGIFEVLDTNPMYAGIKMHPSTFYNWAFHIDPVEITIAKGTVLPERDEDYLNYVRSLPCMCCGVQHRSEAHHLKDNRLGGISQKSPDWSAMPLCHDCHLGIAHGSGWKDCMKWLPLDFDSFTRLCYLRWKNHD